LYSAKENFREFLAFMTGTGAPRPSGSAFEMQISRSIHHQTHCLLFEPRSMLRKMESLAHKAVVVPAADGRQSETALAIARGTARLLHALGFACISELSLPSGRRADLVAINDRGEIWIVEIKSSIEDLRADQKWPEYRAHCDRLFFAFLQDLPCEIFPEETGLIIADAYGAHLQRPAPEHRLPAPTRKSMTVRFARAAALRINRLVDPQGHAEF
jgi:hypothetical protein